MIKKLILTIAAGLISFGVMFGVAWLTAKTPAATNAQEPAKESTSAQKLPSPLALRAAPDEETAKRMRRTMTEKQLKSLVYEVRERIQEYDEKLAGLRSREQRLDVTQNELKKDIGDLNNLRVELASTIATLKEERSKLDKTRIEIEKTEQTNLMSIAATYDKMEPSSASIILINMARIETGSPNDAIKILHFMGERTKADLLAEVVNTEPDLAAYFCQKLKQIVEKK